MTQLMEEQRERAGGEQGKHGGTMKVKGELTEERITRKKWWEDSSEGEGRYRRGTIETNDLWFFKTNGHHYYHKYILNPPQGRTPLRHP